MIEFPKLDKYSPKELHGMGSDAREKDDHLIALQLLDHAIVGYQKEDDFEGMIDALKDRTLTWKHYFLLTKDTSYAILAQKDAEAMLAIAEEKGLKDKMSTSYFRLGEVAMIHNDYSSAIVNYEKSIEHYNGPLSELGDFRYHLGEALYREGQKDKGKKVMLEGLKEIQRGAKEILDFLINVWESGCHRILADLLRKDEPAEAKKHLKEAKRIVNSDERLVIRKRQVRELEDSFN